MKKILIGIDDSKFADYATAYGFKLARQFKAAVGLVHIVEPIIAPVTTTIDAGMGLPSDIGAEMYSVDMMHIQDERGKKMLDDAVKKYGGDLTIKVFEEF